MSKYISYLLFCFLAVFPTQVRAAPTYDHDLGTWTDAYADNTGTSSRSHVNVDTSDGTLKLTNAAGGFTAPYYASGYAITTTIMPNLLAEWSLLSIDSGVPPNTSVKIQILDEKNNLYPDSLLPGNSAGFTDTNIDLSPLPVDQNAGNTSAKFARIRIKVILSTEDPSTTPSVNNLAFSWKSTLGDISTSPLAETAWPISQGNYRGTRHVNSSLSSEYPALRWVTSFPDEWGGGEITRGPGEFLYVKTNGGLTNPKIFSINRNTGTIIWERTLTGISCSSTQYGITADNSLYSMDIHNDVLLAYNLNTGTPKWIKQYTNGHGSGVAIDPSGTIYFNQSEASGFIKIRAVSSDGSEKWTSVIDPPEDVGIGEISIGNDGSVLFGSISSPNPGNGKLYALDPESGDIRWDYPTGDLPTNSPPVVDSDGTIYTANSGNSSLEKKVYAIDQSGNLKWEQSLGVTTDYYRNLSLRSDGVLLLTKITAEGGQVEARNTIDGSLIQTTENLGTNTDIFSDGTNGFFYTGNDPSGRLIFYYNSSFEKKWTRHDATTKYYLYGSPDENNRAYFTVSDVSDFQTKLIALFPWTLNDNNPLHHIYRQKVISLSATTSMQPADLLTGYSNQVQAVMANGDKVALTYDSTNADGDTVWVGEYTLPADTPDGEYEYTLEANAAGIETDITTHFASPAVDSNNTGITASGSFTVDSTPPTDTTSGYAFSLSSPTGYSKDSSKPTLVFSKAADVTSGVASYTVELDPDSHQSWSVTGIPSTHDTTKSSSAWRDDSRVKVEFINEQDSDSANDEIRVYFKSLDDSSLTPGRHTWRVTVTDNAGNTFTKTQDFYLDTTAPSLGEAAVAGVGLLTPNASLASPQVFTLDPNRADQRTPSFSGTVIDTYVGSTKQNTNGTTDTFPKVSSGPSKVTLTLQRHKDSGSSTFPGRAGRNFDRADNLQPSNLKPLDFAPYLTHDYPLTDLKDLPNDKKEAAFFLTSPQPVEDGFYRVTLTLTDGAGNTHTTDPFYLQMNYQSSGAFSGPTGLLDRVADTLTGKQLDFEITEEEKIEEESTSSELGPQDSAPATLRVTIVDRRRQPISNARVELHSEPMVAYTDEQGVAVFDRVEKGEHTLKIAYADYEGEEKLTLTGDEVREFRLTVEVEKTGSPWLWLGGGAVFAAFFTLLFLIRKKRS